MPENFVASEFPMVIIPYKEYEKLLTAARKIDIQALEIARLTERYNALYSLYGEVIEKVSELIDSI